VKRKKPPFGRLLVGFWSLSLLVLCVYAAKLTAPAPAGKQERNNNHDNKQQAQQILGGEVNLIEGRDGNPDGLLLSFHN
jgi:hypothetical protein